MVVRNVLVATAVLREGGTPEMAEAVLDETDPTAFVRSDDAITWRGTRVSFDTLAAARVNGFRGFGSCSFREPVDEFFTRASW